ncbi:hypothetical protein NQ309_26790, partial [Escherichia coli]|nr:hypothetical protein [Escherichia coli]
MTASMLGTVLAAGEGYTTIRDSTSPFFQLVAANAHVFAQLPANLHCALVKEYIAGAALWNLSDRDLYALAS